MDNNYFITNEPNELIANQSTAFARSKFTDWNNGYGKYTVAVILLFAGCNISDTNFPPITLDNWFSSLFIYGRKVLPFIIAFYIYKGSFKSNKNLLIINSRGILHIEDTFYWNDILSFQLSLEPDMKNKYHVYYLHLSTKSNTDHKIDISKYDKKVEEIHKAVRNNVGKHNVKDLGFTQKI